MATHDDGRGRPGSAWRAAACFLDVNGSESIAQKRPALKELRKRSASMWAD